MRRVVSGVARLVVASSASLWQQQTSSTAPTALYRWQATGQGTDAPVPPRGAEYEEDIASAHDAAAARTADPVAVGSEEEAFIRARPARRPMTLGEPVRLGMEPGELPPMPAGASSRNTPTTPRRRNIGSSGGGENGAAPGVFLVDMYVKTESPFGVEYDPAEFVVTLLDVSTRNSTPKRITFSDFARDAAALGRLRAVLYPDSSPNGKRGALDPNVTVDSQTGKVSGGRDIVFIPTGRSRTVVLRTILRFATSSLFSLLPLWRLPPDEEVDPTYVETLADVSSVAKQLARSCRVDGGILGSVSRLVQRAKEHDAPLDCARDTAKIITYPSAPVEAVLTSAVHVASMTPKSVPRPAAEKKPGRPASFSDIRDTTRALVEEVRRGQELESSAATTAATSSSPTKEPSTKTKPHQSKAKSSSTATNAPASKTKAPASKTKAPASKTKAPASKTKAPASKAKASRGLSGIDKLRASTGAKSPKVTAAKGTSSSAKKSTTRSAKPTKPTNSKKTVAKKKATVAKSAPKTSAKKSKPAGTRKPALQPTKASKKNTSVGSSRKVKSSAGKVKKAAAKKGGKK